MYTAASARRRAAAPKPWQQSRESAVKRLILTQPFAAAFQALQVSASVCEGKHWHAIYWRPNIAAFEFSHGKGPERYAYGASGVARVLAQRRTWIGQHAGFTDLFVPVGSGKHVDAVLITGPFATARPTSADVLARWQAITGRHGHPSDPEFAHYLTATLDTLTVDVEELACFTAWLANFADLLAANGDPSKISQRASLLLPKVERARFVDQVWKSASTMVDERTEGEWLAPHSAGMLAALGLPSLPDVALFGLIVARANNADPVADLLQRHEFQRACVELAHTSKAKAIAGKVGEHAVKFLMCKSRSRTRTKDALQQLAQRAVRLARERFGLSIHFGASTLAGNLALSTRYEQAMSAAERALSQGRELVLADVNEQSRSSSLRRLRQQLGALAEQQPNALAPTFERYVQTVYVVSGYRMDLVRAHLQTGLDEACRTLLSTGSLDEKSYLDVCDTLERFTRDVATVHELGDRYERAISDLLVLMEHPAQGRRDRSLRRAIAFVHRRFAEPLTSAEVARIGGFAPAHFCRLFKRREGMTFEQYLRALRVERAKQLLVSTDLSVERVGQLSGFALRPYFHRVFKAALGLTPIEYRDRARPKAS